MSLSDLFSKKLLIVTGKGGVGKTTVSLALALAAAEGGKKVLLAEINSEEQVAHLLEREPTGHREVELLPSLWSINIKPQEAFREYVLLQIRLKSLTRAVFGNRLVRNFIEGTPGLADLISIGKVWSLVDPYDLVIVDAPSSGHAIALLKIASIVGGAVRRGPLKTHADEIDQLLHDREKTVIAAVTLPEELPVTELFETESALRNQTGLRLGPIFLNQHLDRFFTDREWETIGSRAPQAIQVQKMRADHSEFYAERIQQQFPNQPLIRVPFLFSTSFGLPEIEHLSEAIERSL